MKLLRLAPQQPGGVGQQRENRDRAKIDREFESLSGPAERGAQQENRRAREDARDQGVVAPVGGLETGGGDANRAQDQAAQSHAARRHAAVDGRHFVPSARPTVRFGLGVFLAKRRNSSATS